jgi:hypothetical protein
MRLCRDVGETLRGFIVQINGQLRHDRLLVCRIQ